MSQDKFKELTQMIVSYGTLRYRSACSTPETSQELMSKSSSLLANIGDHIATLEQESAANLQRALVAEKKSGEAMDRERKYATDLATYLWRNLYKDKAPNWKPFDDLYGVLSQIDNMAVGIVRGMPTEEELHELNEAIFNALERVAAPHAHVSIAHGAGMKYIQARRDRLADTSTQEVG